MFKRLAIPALIIVGAVLVFMGVFSGDGGPKGNFILSKSQLEWFLDRPALKIEMEEATARNHSESRDHCYAVRNAAFDSSGSVDLSQACKDDDGREYFDNAVGSWRLDGDRLCIDARPLDRDPACWRLRYRNGTFEFLNAAETAAWFGRVIAQDGSTLEDVIAGLTAR